MTVFRRFYLRISAVFLVLLLVLAAAFVIVTVRTFERHRVEIDQQVNSGLAADMAREIEPYLDQGTQSEEVGSAIHYMMVLNPAVEIYLLDPEGSILAYFAEQKGDVGIDRVDLAPIREFFSQDRAFPIFGDDPRHPGERKHFSVAPLTLPSGDEGYLYIVLQSSLYDRARQNLGDIYLVEALRNSVLIALPSVAILGLLVFFLATRRLTGLTETVSTFAQGDYSVRARESAPDEIGELARTFNNMADTIAANHAQLQAADQQRRELIASISHDLRNPLASIRGYTETLLQKNDELPADERRRYLEVSLERSAALSRLVNDLFELATLDARDVAPAKEQFSLSELAQDVVLQMQPRADKRNVSLEFAEPQSLHLVTGDVGMIERAVTNLIDNAVKFSPPQGTVTVAVTPARQDASARPVASTAPGAPAAPGAPPHERGVTLSVTDQGPGVAPEEREHLFDLFYTGDRSRTGSTTDGAGATGSGLGLAIARRIVELHGGAIGVDTATAGEGATSAGSGPGSRFYFTLPPRDGAPAR